MSQVQKVRGIKSAVAKKPSGAKKADPFNAGASRPDSTGGSGLNDRVTSNRPTGKDGDDSEDEY